jgi:Skp family chaperone for outer membrane proteins
MKGLHDQLLQVYSTQAANPMLTSDQQTQLGNLLLKATPTDADKAQIQTLETQSQKDAQALAALQQPKDLTDADRTQLAALTNEQQTGAQALQAVQDDYQQRMQRENDQLVQQISDDIRAAVAAVAKQKGLSLVFSSDAVIYSENDITQAVISKLNGTK